MKKIYYLIALLCMLAQGTWGQTEIDLANITQNTTIPDGAIIFGKLDVSVENPPKISIAAGATITLSGVIINEYGEMIADQAGLTCLGDATIILADGKTNTVCPLGGDWSAIFVPKNSTLTIRGGGALIARSNIMYCGGAGIGGGYEKGCGNIVIDGGIITAKGNTFSAAIGSGYKGKCGNITITNNITSLSADSPDKIDDTFCIGQGWDGSSGTVTIGGQQLTFWGPSNGYGDKNGQVFDPVTIYTNMIHYDSNEGTGTMAPQGVMKVITEVHSNTRDIAISIRNCSYSRPGYAFAKWNTRADGKGTDYAPGDNIKQCWSSTPGDAMTLYAQWMPNEDYFDQAEKGDSEDDPLEISTAEQLDLLAYRVNNNVNSNHGYEGKYFKLMNDITYSYAGLGENGYNFTAIGNKDRPFRGHFDGGGHTISGIRIYKDGTNDANSYICSRCRKAAFLTA